MARQARVYSSTGYMHVIVRGIGKQLLFEENADHYRYLSLLQRYSAETGVSVCAYCMMENHVHLLVCDRDHALPAFMKKLGVSYSAYFNKKYERTGHLFQDRYRSEAVENDAYFLTVLRYILKNPEKAHICPASEYRWSSYRLYDDPNTFVDTSFIKGMLGTFAQYAEYIACEDPSDEPMDEHPVVGDRTAKRIIGEILGEESGTILQSYDRNKRNEAIRRLRKAGLSIRQIERHTGISRGIIQEVLW